MDYLKKTLLALMLFFAASAGGQAADQLVLLADGDGITGVYSYTVPTGHTATVTGVSLVGSTAELRIGSAKLRTVPASDFSVPAGTLVRVYASSSDTDSSAFAALRVSPISAGSDYLPDNALVIPTDAAGDVQILLESSTDLQTWTPAAPGTYSSSTSQRFFRVRAEVIAP